MGGQQIIVTSYNKVEVDDFFESYNVKKIFLVCGKFVDKLEIGIYFEKLGKRKNIQIVKFSNFQSNPSYESVVEGIQLYRKEGCDMIIAVGGGSAMDIAKCIKLFLYMDDSKNYLNQKIIPNDVKLVAVPTTAGTGSEATHFAVIYFMGEKQTISDYSCIPSMVLLDASTLKTLPDYQRKVTMLDAFCHAIESFWSVNSTDESKTYSKEAIRLILKNKELYLANNETGNKNMLYAANLAGKAINIAQTTAGHAMCYKLTTLYGIAHGHAAALCVEKLWRYMVTCTEKCIDPRGSGYLINVFNEIADTMNCQTAIKASENFSDFLREMNLWVPSINNEGEFEILKHSINVVRLKNNPIELDDLTIDYLYHSILK